MVRSVKRCLKKVLRNARLTYEELLTLLIRVEGVLNSRPLTYVYPDQDEPLTPSHLVLGKRILTVPTPGELVGEEEGRNELLKRDKHLKNVSLAEHEYMNIAPPPPPPIIDLPTPLQFAPHRGRLRQRHKRHSIASATNKTNYAMCSPQKAIH